MTKQIAAAALSLVLAASGAAAASDIYKWVDENGNAQYGDRPAGTESERLAIASRPTDPARVQSEVESLSASRARAGERKTAAAEEAAAAEEKRAQAEERAEKCANYRQTLQRFVTSRRLYREDESGERVYLDEAETQAARQRVEEQVSEYCNP